MVFCPKCQEDTETDSNNGNIVCIQCGSVLREDADIVNEVSFSERADGSSAVVGQFVPMSGAPRLGGKRGPSGFNKDSREQTLEKARRKISQVASSLRLRHMVVDRALRLYKMALEHNFVNGRKSYNVIASCLYIVCRLEKTPHMLIDFSDVLETNLFVLGHTFLRFCQCLNLHLPLVDPSLFIPRFASKLEFEDKTQQVSNTALRLVQRMKRDWIHTGRRPSGICGAALLIAAKIHGFQRTQREIIQIVKICDVTLRKRLYEFEDTASSDLTLEEFETIDLEQEADPPAFTRARVKENALFGINDEKENEKEKGKKGKEKIKGKSSGKEKGTKEKEKKGKKSNGKGKSKGKSGKGKSKKKDEEGAESEVEAEHEEKADEEDKANEQENENIDKDQNQKDAEELTQLLMSNDDKDEALLTNEEMEKEMHDTLKAMRSLSPAELQMAKTSVPVLSHLELPPPSAILFPPSAAPSQTSSSPIAPSMAASPANTQHSQATPGLPPSGQSTEGQSQTGFEEDLSDIDDDDEIRRYIHTEDEAKRKSVIWHELNKDYLKALEEKEQQEKEDIAAGKPIKKKRTRSTQSTPREEPKPANSAAEATTNLMLKKTKKINPKALSQLFNPEHRSSTVPSSPALQIKSLEAPEPPLKKQKVALPHQVQAEEPEEVVAEIDEGDYQDLAQNDYDAPDGEEYWDD